MSKMISWYYERVIKEKEKYEKVKELNVENWKLKKKKKNLVKEYNDRSKYCINILMELIIKKFICNILKCNNLIEELIGKIYYLLHR